MIASLTPNPTLQDINLSRNCVDIWTYLDANRASFTSPLYMNPFADETSTTHVFLPPLGLLVRNVTLWTDYFFRFSPYPPSPAGNASYPSTSLRAGTNFDYELYPIVSQEDAWESVLRKVTSPTQPAPTPSLSSEMINGLEEGDGERGPPSPSPPLKATQTEDEDFFI